MKLKLFRLCALISGLSGLSFAAVPPEIPHRRDYQIFSPVYFDIKDNGEATFLEGGPALLEYGYGEGSVAIQYAEPTLAKPDVNFETFLDFLNTPAGIFFLASHGWDDNVVVEAYPWSEEGKDAAGKARDAYMMMFCLV